MVRFAGLLALLFSTSISAQTIVWEDPIEVAPSEFGLNNLRMELDADGLPIILHGKTGANGGLYCTRSNGDGFDAPVQITSETGLFINDSEGPRMAVQGNQVVVGYQISGQWAQGGRTVRSTDGGVTWGDPVAIAPDATEDHFMPTPAFDSDGQPWVAVKWGTNPTLEGILSWEGGAYGAAVDGGSAFPGGVACECCASMPFEHDGRLYNAVRINDNNTRDFHLARTDEDGAWSESLDIDPTNWTLNSCPASEAEVAMLGDGTLAFVYMSAAEGGSRTYWSTVDPETWSLTGSDRIAPMFEFVENHPSVDADGSVCVAAWERNDGGYDIVVGAGGNDLYGPLSWGTSGYPVTEGLSGHSRKPVIRTDGEVVHLVYQRPSEGVIHYLRGYVQPGAVAESESNGWRCVTQEEGWTVVGSPLPMKWILYDALGRELRSGLSRDGRIPASFRGAGILDVRAEGQRRAFHVQR